MIDFFKKKMSSTNDEMTDCLDESNTYLANNTPTQSKPEVKPEDKPRAKSAMEWFDSTIEKYRKKNPEKFNDAYIAKQKAKLLKLL